MYAYIANSTILACTTLNSTVLVCTTLVAMKNPDYQHAYHLDSGATDHIAND